MAKHLGTDHNELYVTAADAMNVIPSLAGMYGEPFADSSAIPTFIVSRFAREQVTVALSGDAGDELFGGYNRYLAVPRLWRAMRPFPAGARRLIASAGVAVPPGVWDRAARLVGRPRPPAFGAKVQKTLRTTAGARAMSDVMASFLDEWHGRPIPVLDHDGSRPPFPSAACLSQPDSAASLMFVDAMTYLPDDILTKVDRAAMACSLETRVPFLDHEVAMAAARLPMSLKISGATTKLVLRRILHQHVPAHLFERPKAGFAIPVGDWLRGPLRDWGEALLDRRRITDEGWFDAGPVVDMWARHQRREGEHTQALWPLLMFQAWLDAGSGREPSAR